MGDHQRAAAAEGPAGAAAAGTSPPQKTLMQQPSVCRTLCCEQTTNSMSHVTAGLLCVLLGPAAIDAGMVVSCAGCRFQW